MLARIVRAALELRVIVVALALLLLGVGINALQRVPLDVFPEFAPPIVEIQTEAPGLSSVEVESLVTVPLESALNGTAWVDTVRSKSVAGLSSVVLLFERGTDLMEARQLVNERLSSAARRLPSVAQPPVMLSPLSSTSRIMKIGVKSRKLSPTQLSTLVFWTVRPKLMAVPGVANVAIWGQRARELQVRVDPRRLNDLKLDLGRVVEATRGSVALAAGGFVEEPNQRLALTHASAIQSSQDLARVPVRLPGGAVVRLGSLADVTDGNPPPIGDAVIDGGAGLLLVVEKQPWGNTLEITRGVESALNGLRPGLSSVEIDSTIFRPATFIERSIDNLKRALFVGCALVVLVLLVFLFDVRAALISAVAIPVSLTAAVLVLSWWGITVNTMILAGLVIALGEVVDDATIDVENVVRRLRENRELAPPRPALDVVLDASLEVRSAIVYASAIVLLVFVPIYFLPGLSGAFFRPLAIAYVLAVGASMLVALTLTPALALLLLGRASRRARVPPIVARLRSAYSRMLPACLARPRHAAIGVVALVVATVSAVPLLGDDFLPDFQESDFLMHWVAKPGTSLPEMQRLTRRVSRELRAIPGVRNFGAHIGRAEVADEVVGIDFAELWISVDPEVDRANTVAQVEQVIHGYPGIYRDVLTYLRERVKEVLSGSHAALVVRIFGPDLTVLRERAEELQRALGAVRGTHNVHVEQLGLVPTIQVRAKPEEALHHGLSPGEIRSAAATCVSGVRVGQVYEDQKSFDVVVRGVNDLADSVESLRRLPIATPSGVLVPLAELADVEVVSTPGSIKREDASRRLDVTSEVEGRDLGSVAREIETRLGALKLPAGYSARLLGEHQEQRDAQHRILLLGGLALLGIVLVLYADFRALRPTLLIFISLPFALVGGVVAAFLGGGVLSLGSLVGFVAVLGIAARNGIMLVSHYRYLERHEGVAFGSGLVVRGSIERVAPILMTALATMLALLPLVIAGDRPGHEIEHPLAVVISGGLFSSTILNLFVLPTLYLRFAQPLGDEAIAPASPTVDGKG